MSLGFYHPGKSWLFLKTGAGTWGCSWASDIISSTRILLWVLSSSVWYQMDNLRVIDYFSSVCDSIILLEGIIWSKDPEPDLCSGGNLNCSDYISWGLNALIETSFLINKAGEITCLFIWVYRALPYTCAMPKSCVSLRSPNSTEASNSWQ